ncbi:MAG: hypothetical protein Q9218_005260 [Villophora microphyllina]
MRRNSFPTLGNDMRPRNPESRGNRPTAEENVPNRFELFLLGDGEKKVTEETDTRELALQSPHCGTLHLFSNIDFASLPDEYKSANDFLSAGIPSTSVFTFNKEDHTLGNMLRARLLQSPHVLFSGYKVPHPLFSKFILRVQTDGTLTPRQAVLQACKDLVTDLGLLSREFTKEWELRKMVGEGVDGMNGV